MTRLDKIQNGKLTLSEAELKRQVWDYLQYGMNQGKWYFDRLNSGEFIEVRGGSRRRVKGCREGTSDFFILTKGQSNFWALRVIFVEVKSEKGRMHPEQGAFQKLVKNQLAEYVIVRSIEDLEKALGFEKNEAKTG